MLKEMGNAGPLLRLVAAGEATRRIDDFLRGEGWTALSERIEDGELSPFRAARELLRQLGLDAG